LGVSSQGVLLIKVTSDGSKITRLGGFIQEGFITASQGLIFFF